MRHVAYDKPPRRNTAVMDGDFRYVMIEAQRWKGRYRLTWRFWCAECGVHQNFVTGLCGRLRNRRCEAHRAPGRPATKDARARTLLGVNRYRRAKGWAPVNALEQHMASEVASKAIRRAKSLPEPAPVKRAKAAPTEEARQRERTAQRAAWLAEVRAEEDDGEL